LCWPHCQPNRGDGTIVFFDSPSSSNYYSAFFDYHLSLFSCVFGAIYCFSFFSPPIIVRPASASHSFRTASALCTHYGLRRTQRKIFRWNLWCPSFVPPLRNAHRTDYDGKTTAIISVLASTGGDNGRQGRWWVRASAWTGFLVRIIVATVVLTPAFYRYVWRGGRGACHQRRIQNMEEEHAVLVRLSHDSRTRVAVAHRSVAPRRYSVIGYVLTVFIVCCYVLDRLTVCLLVRWHWPILMGNVGSII